MLVVMVEEECWWWWCYGVDVAVAWCGKWYNVVWYSGVNGRALYFIVLMLERI